MRKALLAATVAIATMTSAVTAADISVGIDGYMNMGPETVTTTPPEGDETHTKYSTPNMFVAARVGIRTSDLLEISPSFGMGFANQKNSGKGVVEGKEGVNDYEYTTKQMVIGAGVGAYFHVINQDWFELSTGPRFGWKMMTTPKETDDRVENFKEHEYETYKNNTLIFDAPVNFDFLIGDVFGLRLSTELFGLDIHNVTKQDKEVDGVKFNEEKTTDVDFSLLGFDDIPLSLGVFFRF